MTRKLLVILALLLFVSGAWAQSTITVYATNTAGWSKMYIYYWGAGETELPGTPMENFYTDDLEKKYYRATIPAGVDGILFTDGSYNKMTEDVTSKIADGAWWEVNSTISADKYGVEYKGIVPHGNCGTSGHESDVTWVLAGTSPNYALIISGTEAMANYNTSSAGGSPWYSYRNNIKTVVVENGVTSVGNSAFYAQNYLTSATLPSSVTSIGQSAFHGCTNLPSVDIPLSVTSIGNNAFYGCRKLASITIPERVTFIGSYVFCSCNVLSSITVAAGNTKYDSRDNCNAIIETETNTLIHGCKNTTIPSSVTSIGNHAFYLSTTLLSITIPSSVTSIGEYAFYDCYYLKTAVISSGVTSIGNYAFYFCSRLESVAIPSSVTSIGNHAFDNCSKLASINIPNGVISIGDYAFHYCNCTSLTSVDIPSSVTSIGAKAFSWCLNLETVTLNSNPKIGTDAFSDLKDGATVTMSLAVHKADEGEYWTTFYNQYYNFQISDAGGQNTQVFKAALSGTTLTLTELGDDPEEDKIITKDKAVILKSDASPIVMTLTTTDSGNDFSVEEGKTGLSGVSSASGLTANGTQYVLNKGSQGVGFYRMNSGKVIGVGKAYLTYSGALAREFFGFDDVEDGIGSIDNGQLTIDNEGEDIYNLAGQRVAQPAKGLYIVNGKKVFINK